MEEITGTGIKGASSFAMSSAALAFDRISLTAELLLLPFGLTERLLGFIAVNLKGIVRLLD